MGMLVIGNIDDEKIFNDLREKWRIEAAAEGSTNPTAAEDEKQARQAEVEARVSVVSKQLIAAKKQLAFKR